MSDHRRPAGDDRVIQLRIRSVNLPALEAGIELGIDHVTGRPIELRLWPRPDGVHELEVITNAEVMMAAPEPVGAEVVIDHG